MKILRHKRQELDINLTPLIDIVFLLLIFFMVSTTFTKETRLMLHLPEAEGQSGGDPVEVIEITVSATSEYAVNGKALVNQKIQTLMSAIVKLSDQNNKIPVALSADKNAPHQAVVKALDALGRLGFSNIQITTKAPSGEG